MDDLTRTKQKRFEFLNLIYRKSNGDETETYTIHDLAEKLGMDLNEAERVSQYLEGEGLIDTMRAFGAGNSSVNITHRGVIEIEKALDAPEKSTEYFPAINIISVAHMSNSQIQQGTQHSQQTTSYEAPNVQELVALIQQFRAQLSSVELSDKDRAEAESELQTLEAQTHSPRPKAVIIRESLSTVKDIFIKAAPTVLIEATKRYLAQLPG